MNSQSYSPQQVLRAVQAQRELLNEQWKRLAEVERLHNIEREKIIAERDEAALDLSKAMLPALDASSIARAAQLCGLVGLPAEDLPGRREARRAFLVSRLRTISVEPLYRDRELLRHPRTGSIPQAIAENSEHRRPLAEVVGKCESHARFARLMEVGFGIDDQSVPWWRFSYWSDRSAASEIVATFPAKENFSEVREDYVRAKEAVAIFDAEIHKLRATIAAGEALDREYVALYNEHQHIDEWALQQARVRIVRHMLEADASLMTQRLSRHKDETLLFLRASGLSAKLTYLDAIHKKNADELRTELNAQKAKIDGVYQRGVAKGRGMPADKFQIFAVNRGPKYEKRWQRWGKTYQTVQSYDHWDRGRFYEDLLWWDLMTRGRHDGSYIREVTVFHQSHPHYEYDPTPPRHHHHPAATQDDERDVQSDRDAAARSAEVDGAGGDNDDHNAGDSPDTGGDLTATDAS